MSKNGDTCDVHAAKVHTATRNKVAVLPLCAQAPLLTGSTLPLYSSKSLMKEKGEYSCKGSAVCIIFVVYKQIRYKQRITE